MKILHVMQKDYELLNNLYIQSLLVFSNKHPDEIHDFCYLERFDKKKDKNSEKTNQHAFFFSFRKKNLIDCIKFSSLMTKYDEIILHSFALPTYFQLFLILFTRKIIKKVKWIAWGGDLYQIRQNIERPIDKLGFHVTMKMRNLIPTFVGIFPPDIQYFQKNFNTEAKTYYAPYGLTNNLEIGKTIDVTIEHDGNEPIVFQIGHSASNMLNHFEVLDLLSKFKDRNICIYLPLAYGDMNYAKKVEDYALSIFGEKVIVQNKMLDSSSYQKRLARTDVAFFDTNRQQALGNIYSLLRYNKKIYLPKKSIMYDFFSTLDVPISSIDDIKNSSFEELVKPVHSCSSKFKKFLMDNNDKYEEYWENVFQNR